MAEQVRIEPTHINNRLMKLKLHDSRIQVSTRTTSIAYHLICALRPLKGIRGVFFCFKKLAY